MAEPDYFYRYRSLASDDNLNWVRQSILYSQHYFASPLSFNDPFDCRPNLVIQGTTHQLIKYYEDILAKRRPELSRESRRAEARQRISNPDTNPRIPSNLPKIREIYHAQVTARVGVLCLSEVPDDILMWAHYADSHRGICLILNGRNAFFSTAHPVNYEKVRPEVNPITDSHEEMLDRSMFTKSDHWAYEKEWRILQYEHGANTYTLPTDVLVGIFLGSQISSKHEELITKWAKESSSKPWIRKATLSSTEFKIAASQ